MKRLHQTITPTLIIEPKYESDSLGKLRHRFTVPAHEDIHQQICWRSGVMLQYQDAGKTYNLACVKTDPEDQKIFIAISGKESTRRTFLAMLRRRDHRKGTS